MQDVEHRVAKVESEKKIKTGKSRKWKWGRIESASCDWSEVKNLKQHFGLIFLQPFIGVHWAERVWGAPWRRRKTQSLNRHKSKDT